MGQAHPLQSFYSKSIGITLKGSTVGAALAAARVADQYTPSIIWVGTYRFRIIDIAK